LETDGQYPKKIAFDVWEDKVALAEDEKVTLQVNIESREYNGKWYTNISAWKKDSQGAAAPAAAPVQQAPAAAQNPLDFNVFGAPNTVPGGAPIGDQEDSLPF
jgi:hypothetical protein